MRTVFQKSHKKKFVFLIVPPTILIIEEEKRLYVEIYYSDKDTIITNHALFQILKQALADTFSQKEKFII